MKLKNRNMNKLIFSLLFISFGFIAYSQTSGKLMPVTASSETALSLYNKAVEYYDAVHIEKAIESFNDALNKDADLFMANYQLAFHYLMNQEWDGFKRHSRAAINCKARLSEGEKLLKEALVTISEGSLDVVYIGRKLVELYPGDPNAYNNLISFQSLADDTEGMVETIKKAITIAVNQAPFYNQLGYAYLILKQEEKKRKKLLTGTLNSILTTQMFMIQRGISSCMPGSMTRRIHHTLKRIQWIRRSAGRKHRWPEGFTSRRTARSSG